MTDKVWGRSVPFSRFTSECVYATHRRPRCVCCTSDQASINRCFKKL